MENKMEPAIFGLGFRVYSPPEINTVWLWLYYKKIPIYPIFYLLKGDYTQVLHYWFQEKS